MIANDGTGAARRRRSGDRLRIWIDDGMNRVRPAGAWSRVLALPRVLVVVLVLMFVGVLVAAIMIVITLEFMARHPNVGTNAGAERRASHSTAGTAAPSKGTFCRGDQENPRRQNHSPAGQFAICLHRLISFRKIGSIPLTTMSRVARPQPWPSP